MTLRERIAQWLAPERSRWLDGFQKELFEKEKDIEMRVNIRVADIIMKMDPWEPLLKKYNVVFSQEYEKPEDNLNPQSQIAFFMWAHGIAEDPHFKHLMEWYVNKQGNNTLRKGTNDNEWFFGRAVVATISLLVREVGRLSARYSEVLENRKPKGFNDKLAVE